MKLLEEKKLEAAYIKWINTGENMYADPEEYFLGGARWMEKRLLKELAKRDSKIAELEEDLNVYIEEAAGSSL